MPQIVVNVSDQDYPVVSQRIPVIEAMVHVAAAMCQPDSSVMSGSSIVNNSSVVPVFIGQRGEEYVFDLLSSIYNVTNCTKMAKSGDLVLTFNNHKYMIEVKNYVSPVGKQEIAKFLRDMEANEYSGGLLISLNSKISSMKHPLEITRARFYSSHCIYYLSCADIDMDMRDETIKNIVKIMVDTTEKMIDVNYEIFTQHDLSARVTELRDSTTSLSELRGKIMEGITDISQILTKIYNNIAGVEIQLRSTVTNLDYLEMSNRFVLESNDSDSIPQPNPDKFKLPDELVIIYRNLVYALIDQFGFVAYKSSGETTINPTYIILSSRGFVLFDEANNTNKNKSTNSTNPTMIKCEAKKSVLLIPSSNQQKIFHKVVGNKFCRVVNDLCFSNLVEKIQHIQYIAIDICDESYVLCVDVLKIIIV